MIFYRSDKGPRDLSLQMVRALSAATLLAYPAGALTMALGPDTAATLIAGSTLLVLSLISFTFLAGSSIQRIVAEEEKVLDEFERRLRGRAINRSYATFTALALLAVIYAAIASDKGGWVPSTYEEFNGLFWGVFLYAAVLPTAILSWNLEPSFVRE